MGSASSESRKVSSNLTWKIISVIFIVVTISASGSAYYYYQQTQNKISNDSVLSTQIQQLQRWVSGNATLANNYQTQVNSLQGQLDTMGKLTASQTAELQGDKTTIAGLQSSNANLQSSLASLQLEYSILLGSNGTLTLEVKALTVENEALGMVLHSLGLQLGNLTRIANLQVSKTLADSSPITWTAGTTTISVPEASVDYNYSGYISVSWQATDPLTFSFSYNVGTNSTLVQSTNSAKEDYNLPVIGSPLSPTAASGTFQNHNTDCLFHSCAGTVYVTITYWY